MKRFLFLAFLTACLGPFVLCAQNNQANEYMNAGKYSEAIEILENARSRGTAVTTDLVNLAYCQIMMHDYKKAEEVYAFLVLDKKAEVRQWFLYGEVLRINGKYAEAKSAYQRFFDENPGDFAVKQRLLSCDSLIKWTKAVPEIAVENVTEINTIADEMSPVPYHNELYFVSNNRDLLSKTGATTRFADPQVSFIYNVYGEKIQNVKVFRPFSDSVSYTGISINGDEHALIVKPVKKTPDGEFPGNSVMMIGSSVKGYKDFKAANLPAGYVSTHPCLTENGRRLYFSSNIPGGYGGVDLYYSDFDGATWSAPVNLGSAVNTPGDEMFPWVDEAHQRLYFASDGHPGYGNLDLFVSALTGDTWGAPVNMKAPVNSAGNDFSLIISDQPYKGYMVSNRYGSSKGGNDIFAVHFPEPAVIKDTVVPPVAEVIPSDTNLIFFKTASSLIDPSFYAALDQVAGTLKKYPYLRLNISTWADARGTEKFNESLCSQRAEAVAEYLSKQGIDGKRLLRKSFGVTKTSETNLIRYHVQIGYMPQAGLEPDFLRWIHNEAPVNSTSYGKGYYYYAGEGSLAEMKQLLHRLKAKYGIDGLYTATYGNYYLGDIHYAPCRRAVLTFSK